MYTCKSKQDIADAAYRKRRGRPQLPGLGKVIADVLFSLLLQGLFLIQVSTITIITLTHITDYRCDELRIRIRQHANINQLSAIRYSPNSWKHFWQMQIFY